MPTLTSTEILMDVIRSFTTQFPAFNRMGTDLRPGSLKLGQTYIAHIPTLPVTATYDANNGGYRNGAQSGRSLLVDVPIVIDRHEHVPIKFTHLDAIKDQKNKYDECIANAGYVLAKAVIDDLLSGVTSRNFSQSAAFSLNDSDLDMVTDSTSKMNKRGALPSGRTMIVNTDVATALGNDSRISSKDYHGQQTGGNALRRWTDVGGFADIIEYPDMPTNNGAPITVTTTAATDLLGATAHGLQDGDRVLIAVLTGSAGLTDGNRYFVRDATADTFKVAAALGGAAINITSDGTATVSISEELSSFAFDPRAFSLLAGIPGNFDSESIAGIKIPRVMGFESITDPVSKLTMAAVSWQEEGTGDLYWSPTLVWGKALGRQGAANAAGSKTDYAGHRITLL